MKLSLLPYLGQTVKVVIDRPLGSVHPRYPDLIYPVNYGELPDTISCDGHPIDVYVLGVDHPVELFTGIVIAIVVRENDSEDKLVVAESGNRDEKAIRDAVHFQERFFRVSIVT